MFGSKSRKIKALASQLELSENNTRALQDHIASIREAMELSDGMFTCGHVEDIKDAITVLQKKAENKTKPIVIMSKDPKPAKKKPLGKKKWK